MCIVGPSSRKPSLMCRVNLLSPHSSSLSSQSAVGGEGSCCCSVAQSYPTLCDPMDCSTPGSPVLHHLKLMSIKSVMPSNHIVLCHPLLLLPSVFPSIRVFSNESAPRIRWPKFWSFSFSISPSSVYSGSISFRIDWFELFAVQGTLKSLLQNQFKSINSSVLSLLYGPILTSIHDYWKNHSFE